MEQTAIQTMQFEEGLGLSLILSLFILLGVAVLYHCIFGFETTDRMEDIENWERYYPESDSETEYYEVITEEVLPSLWRMEKLLERIANTSVMTKSWEADKLNVYYFADGNPESNSSEADDLYVY